MTSSSTLPRPLVALGAAIATALASVVLVAPPAQAAWQGVARLHGGVTQVCVVPARSGLRVRVRLDNRRSNHAHLGALQTNNGRRSRLPEAAAGRLSGVQSLVVGRRARVVVGIGEPDGAGAVAGTRRASRLPRC